MDIPKDIYKKITKKHGSVIDLKKHPEVLEDILKELRSLEQADYSDYKKKTAAPFNVSWMDSWMAHWVIGKDLPANTSDKEFSAAIRQLVDAKFKDRLAEISRFIRERMTPDGGPPEPGTPPVGPAGFFSPPPEDPDGFRSPPPEDPDDFRSPPPEDPDGFRVPTPLPPDPFFRVNEPPDGGPPEPGVPEPPDPGPDPGPGSIGLRDNPWILYWFVSINTPLILDLIDAHFTRRMNDLRMK